MASNVGEHRSHVAVCRSTQLHCQLGARDFEIGRVCEPSAQFAAPGVGQLVNLLRRTPGLLHDVSGDPAVSFHAAEHFVDLLMRRRPEEPDRAVKTTC